MRRLMSARWRHEHRRAIRLMATASLAVALVGGLATAAVAAGVSGNPFGNEQVGTSYANGILLPTNQWIKPIGSRLLVGKGRVLSSSISPNGQYLAALTWNDFTGFLTIINLKTGQIIQQLGTGASGDPVIGDGTVAADGPLWSADGKSLWFPQTSTDFYPVGAQYDPAIGKIVVTNDKGIGARGPGKTVNEGPGTAPGAGSVTGHNTYSDTGSLTEFTMPSTAALGAYTHQVFVDNGWEHLLASRTLTNCSAAAAAVPARLGCPSTIKHVFLIVRENRTYDQVFGDAGKGNDDPTLAQFGATITPNAHKLASSYGLFDNFYDEGTLSADGHNWLVQADANDYIEREFGAFYRSYPAQGGDALAYQRDGFLWNAAEAAGRTVKAFGEYNNFITQPDPVPSWSDYYQDSQILEGKATGPLPVPISATNTYADIPSLNAIDDHAYPAFNLGIPDQYRTDIWLQSFNQSVKTGQLANLNLIWMPDDHTAGVGSGDPNPVAEVADNDLAVGRIIDTISHSKFWKNSAVFWSPARTPGAASSTAATTASSTS